MEVINNFDVFSELLLELGFGFEVTKEKNMTTIYSKLK